MKFIGSSTPLNVNAQFSDAGTWLQIRPFFIGAGIVLFLLALLLGGRALRARRDEAASVEEGFEAIRRRVQGLDRLYEVAAVLMVGFAVMAVVAVALWRPSGFAVNLGDSLLFAFALLAPAFLLFYLLRYAIGRPKDSALTKMVEKSYSKKGAHADSPESLSRLMQTYRYYREEKNLPPGVPPPALFNEIETQILEKISSFGMRYVVPFSKKQCAVRAAHLATNVLVLAILLILPLVPINSINSPSSDPQTTSTDKPNPKNSAPQDEAANAAQENPLPKDEGSKGETNAGSLNRELASSNAGDKESSSGSEAGRDSTASQEEGKESPELASQNPKRTESETQSPGPALTHAPYEEDQLQRKGEQQDQNETAEKLTNAVEQKPNGAPGSEQPSPSDQNEPLQSSGGAGSETAQKKDEGDDFLSWLKKTLFSDDSKQTANAGEANETSPATEETQGESSSKSDNQSGAASTLAKSQSEAGNSASGQAGSSDAPTQNPTPSQEVGNSNSPAGSSVSSFGKGTNPNVQGRPTYPPTTASPDSKEFSLATQSSSEKTKEVIDKTVEASSLETAPRPARYNKLHALRPRDVTITPTDPLLTQRIPKAYESTIKRLLTKHE